MESMQALVGQTLGQYRVIEQIGKGGMASVFKAYQPGLDREVALKVLPPSFAKTGDFSERFIREAQAIGNLHHPNILPVYDSGQDKGYSYLAMRYVPKASTMTDEMKQSLNTERIIDLITQIAAALDYAHQAGIIHRDIKPSNVLLDGDWALLSDFGLAKMVEGSVDLTDPGVGMGTPAYMSPEQGMGKKVDHRTDIYALGIILFEMLTGQVPHKAETPIATVVKRLNEPLPMPRSLNPNIPEAVERVILKALAVDPAHRFQKAGDMARVLKSAFGDQSQQILPEVNATLVQPEPKTVVTPAGQAVVEAEPPKKSDASKFALPINIFGFVGIGLLILLVLCALGVLIAFQLMPERSPITWEYVLDLSDGMNESFPGEGVSKWEAARQSVNDDLALMPEQINVGLRVFGEGSAAESCSDTTLLVKPNPKQVAKIQDKLAGLAPAGAESPLTEAIVQAFNDLELAPDKQNALIILTDGGDSCDPDGPEQLTRFVERLNITVDTYIVGLGIEDPAVEENLKALASASDGIFLPVNSASQLGDVLELINDNFEAEKRPDEIALAPTGTPTSVPSPTPAPTATEAVPVALTGQEAFDLALAEAQGWQSDAVLADMQSTALGPVDADGKSESWSIQLISPSANETNSMTFMNGTFTTFPMANSGSRPIPAADSVILDTKQIYDIAAGAGGSEFISNGANVNFALTKYPGDDEIPTWYVRYTLADGSNPIIVVDARTGEVMQVVQ